MLDKPLCTITRKSRGHRASLKFNLYSKLHQITANASQALMTFHDAPSFGIPLDRSYCAFGDGSETVGGVHYGMVLLPDARVDQAIHELRRLKVLFNGRSTDPIHCRELFWGDLRNRGPWAHLNEGKALRLGEEVLAAMAGLEAKFLIASLPTDCYPKQFRLKGKNGFADVVHCIDTKWLTLWKYFEIAKYLLPTRFLEPQDPTRIKLPPGSAAWRVQATSSLIGLLTSKLYLDRETTVIHWFNKKLKWSSVAEGFVISGPFGASHLPIQSQASVKHELLEVADLFVWMMGKTIGGSPKLTWEVSAENLLAITLGSMGEEWVIGG